MESFGDHRADKMTLTYEDRPMDLFRPLDKKSKSAFRKKFRKFRDPAQVLACPSCGSDKVRPIKVNVYAGQCHTHITNAGTLCEGDDPVGWGAMINLLFACECGEVFVLNFQYFDRETEFDVVSMGHGQDSPVIYWQPEERKKRRGGPPSSNSI
jgi:hypothetical protein